jgi:hypothetical protein
MKRNCWTGAITLMLSITVLAGCGSAEKKAPEPVKTATEQYQCPMKCSDQLFDKPGKCPVCDMELEKITKS